MKKLFAVAAVALAMAFSTVTFAADTAPAPTKPAATKKAATPKTIMGDVVSYTAGKSLEVKDAAGKTHKYSISSKTKVEGDVKVGAKVDVTSMGKWAQDVKAEMAMATPPPAAAAPPAAAPATPKK